MANIPDPENDVRDENAQEAPTPEELEAALAGMQEILAKAAREIEILTNDRDSWREKTETIFDQYTRLKTDMDGYRKRTERDLETKIQRAKADFIKGFLDVLDNFQRFLQAAEGQEKGLQSFVKGVSMIERQIFDYLVRDGLQEIPSPVGSIFDPALHEAVSAQDGGGDHGLVVEELQKGFTYKEEVIRATKVKVIR